MIESKIYNILKNELKNSTCLKRQVSALLLNSENTIVSLGVNTSHGNLCKEKNDCLRKDVKSGESLDVCRAVHAEVNCIINFINRFGKKELGNCSIWVYNKPCNNCFSLIASMGINKIYYFNDYNSNDNHIEKDTKKLGIETINLSNEDYVK